MATHGTPRMTPSQLGEALDGIRVAMPSLEEEFQRVFLAMELILTFLGPDWLATHIIGEDSPPFLRDWRVTTGDPEAFIALQRIVSLGSALYCLQDVPGFPEELREVRSNHIRGAWYELWVANRLQRHGVPMAFRPRSGVKGQDYGFDVEVGGERVAIEAKACDPRSHADFQPAAATNLLHKAARQLPKSGPSVIFVAVLWPHGGDPDVRRRAAEAADDWLRNHARVNRIFLEFEEASLMQPAGCAIVYRQAVIDNPGARAPMDLDSLGRGAKIGNGPIHFQLLE